MRIGFVGLGSMGGDQANCLAHVHPDVSVYDAFPAAMERFRGKARLAESLADLGRNCDVVGVCVQTDQQVRDVIDGDGGLLSGMAPDSVIMVHSTIRPNTVIELAGKAAARGVKIIDGGVTRTVYTPGDGPFVLTMVGGDADVIARVRPVLDAFSTDVVHAGRLGAGMTLKICNNMVALVESLIGYEANKLANAGGVDSETLVHVLKSNGNISPGMEFVITLAKRFTGSKEEMQTFLDTQSSNGEKDLALAGEVAAELGVTVPVAVHGKDYYREAFTSGLKDL